MLRSRRLRLAVAAVLAAVSMSSCAGWVELDGRIAPATLADPARRAALEHAVVWFDSLPAAAARRLAANGRLALLTERRGGFVPPAIAIASGGTVRIENRDQVWHQAFGASPGGHFETTPARPGSTRAVRFDSAGVVGVWCALHPEAPAMVRVLPHGGFAGVDRRGRFRLPAMPPGTYRVRAWHPEMGEIWRTVTIAGPGRDTLRLSFAAALARRNRRGTPAWLAAGFTRGTGAARAIGAPRKRAARPDGEAGPRYLPRLSADS